MDDTIQVIVGLGNPGVSYDHTRHNIGFDVVDRLAAEAGKSFATSWRLPGHCAEISIKGKKVLLFKPTTYMNRSGQAIKALRRRKKIPLEKILIIFDDLDLALGRIRVRAHGNSGGHNGVSSIIEHTGSNAFPRLRVGIGPRPRGAEVVDFVLGTWPEPEKKTVEEVVSVTADCARCCAKQGLTAAMNRYNQWKWNGQSE